MSALSPKNKRNISEEVNEDEESEPWSELNPIKKSSFMA